MQGPGHPTRHPGFLGRIPLLSQIRRWLDRDDLSTDRLEGLMRLYCEPASRGGNLTPFYVFGYRCHVLFAMLFCFGLGGPTSLTDASQIPLAITAAWRMIVYPRLIGTMLTMPVLALAMFAFAWGGISTAWSPDPGASPEDLQGFRFAWLVIGLYPVLRERRLLIVSLILGFVAGNISQLVHLLQVRDVIDARVFNRDPTRISGWWDPVVGGSLLVAVLTMHASVALLARSWSKARLFAIGASVVTGVGLLATGTRGAWIAAALALGSLGLFWIARGDGLKRRAVRAGVGLGALVVVAAGGWVLAGDEMQARVEQGRAEIHRALVDKDYASDTGARLMMWSLAVDAFSENPVRGLGAGGYYLWARERHQATSSIQNMDTVNIHDHAHNSVLHLLATQGLVGGVLWTMLVGGALWTVFRSGPYRPIGTYGGALPFLIVGLLLTGITDTTQNNMQTAALFWAVCGLCPPLRPREREELVSDSVTDPAQPPPWSPFRSSKPE